MSEIAHEIASQPACWRRAVEIGVRSRATLPSPGSRAAVVGCGTSWFMAQAYASLRESLGQGETDAFTASEAPLERPYGFVVVISRSGTTTEVARYLEHVRGPRRVAVVGSEGTPVAEASDDVIPLSFADERSIVQTRFATTALALLRSGLGEDLAAAIRDAEAVLEDPLPIETGAFDHLVFLAEGWRIGLASEAALKFREAAQAWTEAYPAMEYRHGPISVAGPRSVVWALGEVDAGVLEASAATGATVVGGKVDPMAELVMIQRAAVALAEHRGLDPDRPRHLTRSVMLS
jgi:fructoselysine-6-P-deglycase FrlB-like protein